jgi:serine/threonine protein kinase
MSDVRRGRDTVLDRPVAIKLLRGDRDPRSVARFEREARVLARLVHPNVVGVFDVDAEGDERFIVMELVEGATLREVLKAEGWLAPQRAAKMPRPVVDLGRGRPLLWLRSEVEAWARSTGRL